MHVHAIVKPLLLIALATPAFALAKETASGTFNYGGNQYTAVDAVAWSTGGSYPIVHVVLSDKRFDTTAMAADGHYDEVDLMRHPGANLDISFNPDDGRLLGIRLRDAGGSGADFRCEGAGLLKLASYDASSVAGTFKCEEHDVTFEAPVLQPPKAESP